MWYASNAYVVECDLGNPYPAKYSMYSKIFDAFLSEIPRSRQPAMNVDRLRLHLGGVFLAHRAPELVGLAERESRQLARQAHDLFLVGDDPVGLFDHGLHLRELVLHLDPAVFAGDVVVDDPAPERPGPVERVQRDEVFEALRLRLSKRVTHARAFELEHAVRLAGLKDLIRLRVVQRQPVEVDRRRRSSP